MSSLSEVETGNGHLDTETKPKKQVGFVVDNAPSEIETITPEQDDACQEYHAMEYEHTGDLEDARCPVTNKKTGSRKKPKSKDADTHSSFRCWPCRSWSFERARLTILGCTSSCIVLAVRLYLDREPLAYFIHSIIVFLDMILIHLFTNTWWLSLLGELVTYASFLLFHFEKETVYELLETTLIAVLCSFQIIASRSQVKDHNEKLRGDIKQLRRQTVLLLRRSTVMNEADVTASELDSIIEDTRAAVRNTEDDELKVDGSARNVLKDWFLGHQSEVDLQEVREKATVCGERFFEHFLDGSAGVMYTSFLGLIITELIRYGESSY